MAMPKIAARCARYSQKPARSARVSEASNRGATAGARRRVRRDPSAPDGGGGERLLDEHDRNVGDDRIDQAGSRAVEPLLHHRLLVPEGLAVPLHQGTT